MPSSLNGTGVSFSDGTSQPSAWVGIKSQLFTASGTFTVPTGVTSVRVTIVGGGSGGNSYWGIAGFQGGIAYGYYTVTPGAAITVTVGAGSAAFGGSGLSATGGTSSFGALCSATGGTGVGNGSGANGTTGSGSGGTLVNTSATQTRYTTFSAFTGAATKATGAAATAWTATSGTVPGAGGFGVGGCPSNIGYGACNGVCFVEW